MRYLCVSKGRKHLRAEKIGLVTVEEKETTGWRFRFPDWVHWVYEFCWRVMVVKIANLCLSGYLLWITSLSLLSISVRNIVSSLTYRGEIGT